MAVEGISAQLLSSCEAEKQMAPRAIWPYSNSDRLIDTSKNQIKSNEPNIKRKINETKEEEIGSDDPLMESSAPTKRKRLLSSGEKGHRRGKKKSGKNHKRKRLLLANDPDMTPKNTTQFIMNDHSDTVQFLDQKLGVTPKELLALGESAKPRRITRARESSFSLESGDDTFYSSPEDEEDFVNREFLKDYNSMQADRLVAMTKSQLIDEYLQMEARIDDLEKRLEQAREREEEQADGPDYDIGRGEVPMEPEMAEKIRIFQNEIHSLELANQDLQKELKEMRKLQSSSDDNDDNNSSDSDSDESDSSSSDSSSSSSESDDDDDDDGDTEVDANPDDVPGQCEGNDEEPAQDTGYDSEQSCTKRESRQKSSSTDEKSDLKVDAVTSTS